MIESFAHKPDTVADFTERRFFPFKKAAVELQKVKRQFPGHAVRVEKMAVPK